MVFKFKCFELLPLGTEVDARHNGQTQSSSPQRGGKSSQTKSSSAESYHSANPNFSEWPEDEYALEVFTYLELKNATGNFSPSMKFGEGDFGSVYKAVIQLPDEKLQVMVKLLNEKYIQEHREWANKIKHIGSFKHPNLVKLVGYCFGADGSRLPRLLVYEYFPNGSVRDHLSAKSGVTLSWAERLKIARDAAYCLACLHVTKDFQFIYGKFKSSNVLLDDEYNAKLFYSVMDMPVRSEGLHDVSVTALQNSGYEAPEYSLKRNVTSMYDVWSYGVFICELITGRCPVDPSRPKNEQKMVEWVKPCLNSKGCIQIVDHRLVGRCSVQSLENMSKIAKLCLAKNPKARPTMMKVLDMVNLVVMEDHRGEKVRPANRNSGASWFLTQLCSSELKSSQ